MIEAIMNVLKTKKKHKLFDFYKRLTHLTPPLLIFVHLFKNYFACHLALAPQGR